MARPSSFNQEVADKVCLRISKGESLRDICKDEDMPDAGTIYNWILDSNNVKFFKQYAKAKDSQAEFLFDEILAIADDDSKDKRNSQQVARDRLRVDTRKWYLSKVLPKKYGDKLDLTSDGKVLPTPIYGGSSVSKHHSNKEDIQSQETN